MQVRENFYIVRVIKAAGNDVHDSNQPLLLEMSESLMSVTCWVDDQQ